MSLPKIDVSALPDLPEMTGVFGSHQHQSPQAQSNDILIILMCYIYEIA